MTPEQLRELLEILQEAGVTFYSAPGLTLNLAPPPVEVVVPGFKPEARREEPEAPRSQYHSPHLFPGGKPPKFPGSE